MKSFVSWSFAIDESTDVKDAAQLTIFIKGVDKELNETEELLSLQCTSMKDTTTGANIFSEVLNAFDKFGLHLSTLCEIATDGVQAMSGTGVKFVGLLKSALKEKNISNNIAVFNCIIHQKNICPKSLKFKHVMGPVIKAIKQRRRPNLQINLKNCLKFNARFEDFKSHKHLFEIFSSPFHTDIDKAPTDIRMELIDLQERTNLKAKYVEMNLGDFYRKYLDQDKFSYLRKFIAFKMALFGSTYLRKQFFSKMGFMKSPYRSIMTDEHLDIGLKVASTSIKVNLNRVVQKKN